MLRILTRFGYPSRSGESCRSGATRRHPLADDDVRLPLLQGEGRGEVRPWLWPLFLFLVFVYTQEVFTVFSPMGLWSYFGQAFSSPKKVGRLEVKRRLSRLSIESSEVTESDRAVVLEALEPVLKSGGVSQERLKKTLRKLREQHQITRIDEEKIMDALFDES